MIKNFIKKNIKIILKIIWGILLFISGLCYILFNYERFFNSLNLIDCIIIIGTFILAFYPFISEITLFGFSVKKEIQNTKQEMKEALIDLKYQMIDIKTTSTQTQNLNIELLPSKDYINDVLNKINEINSNSTKVAEQKKVEIENEFGVTDDAIYLFKVRAMMENYMNNICGKFGYTKGIPFMYGIDILKRENLVNSDTYQYLRQLLSICNRGIHGEIISKEYIDFI